MTMKQNVYYTNYVQSLIGWLNAFTASLLLLIFGLDLLRLFNCLVVKLLHEKISLQISLISKIVSNSAHNVRAIIFICFLNFTRLFMRLYNITVRSLDKQIFNLQHRLNYFKPLEQITHNT